MSESSDRETTKSSLPFRGSLREAQDRTALVALVATSLVALMFVALAQAETSLVSRTDLAVATAFREGRGLNAEPTFVSAMLSEPPANESIEIFSTPLTDSELSDLMAREERAGQAYLIREEAQALAPLQFAGIFVDQKNGGRIKVLFTKIPRGFADRLSSIVTFASQVDLVEAIYSLQELQNVQQAAMSATAELAMFGIKLVAADIDEPTNRVVLGVEEPTEPKVAKLEDLFGLAVDVVEAGQMVELIHGESERQINWYPITAGIGINFFE